MGSKMFKVFFFLMLITINLEATEKPSCGNLQAQFNNTQGFKPSLDLSGLKAEQEILNKTSAQVIESRSDLQNQINRLRKPYLSKLLSENYMMLMKQKSADAASNLQLTSDFEALNNYLAHPDCFQEVPAQQTPSQLLARKYRCQYANKQGLTKAPETKRIKLPSNVDADLLMTPVESQDLRNANAELNCLEALLSKVKEQVSINLKNISAQTPSK